MKYVYLSGAAILLLSLLGNLWLYKKNETLTAEKDAIYHEMLQTVRDADSASVLTVDKATQEAARMAKGQRDVLKEITETDSFSTVLERCRRGLFGKDSSPTSDCGDTAAGVDDATGKAGDAAGPQKRE